jgi:hypothetical protein
MQAATGLETVRHQSQRRQTEHQACNKADGHLQPWMSETEQGGQSASPQRRHEDNNAVEKQQAHGSF